MFCKIYVTHPNFASPGETAIAIAAPPEGKLTDIIIISAKTPKTFVAIAFVKGKSASIASWDQITNAKKNEL